jgi:hypothetical protein
MAATKPVKLRRGVAEWVPPHSSMCNPNRRVKAASVCAYPRVGVMLHSFVGFIVKLLDSSHPRTRCVAEVWGACSAVCADRGWRCVGYPDESAGGTGRMPVVALASSVVRVPVYRSGVRGSLAIARDGPVVPRVAGIRIGKAHITWRSALASLRDESAARNPVIASVIKPHAHAI